MKNHYEIVGDVTIIFLKRKGVTYRCYISTSDLELVSSIKGTWCVDQKKIDYTSYCKCGRTSLHRFILGLTDPKVIVDHLDHNGLNNTRGNIRIATYRENNLNRRFGKPKYNIYNHPWWGEEKFTVMIRGVFIGAFNDKIDAIVARNRHLFSIGEAIRRVPIVASKCLHKSEIHSSPI